MAGRLTVSEFVGWPGGEPSRGDVPLAKVRFSAWDGSSRRRLLRKPPRLLANPHRPYQESPQSTLARHGRAGIGVGNAADS
jgi:hypothetical protein